MMGSKGGITLQDSLQMSMRERMAWYEALSDLNRIEEADEDAGAP